MSTQERFFIVNTNRKYRPDACREMLEEEKASAYYERKEKITNIKKGNTVFLYHNLVGIIAFGKASDNYSIKDYNGDEDAEYYIPLEFDWKINPDTEPFKAVKFSEISIRLEKPPIFDQAVFPIDPIMAGIIIGIANRK